MKYILFLVAIAAITCAIDLNTVPNIKPIIPIFPPIVPLCKKYPKLCASLNDVLAPENEVNLKGGNVWVDLATNAIPAIWDLVKTYVLKW